MKSSKDEHNLIAKLKDTLSVTFKIVFKLQDIPYVQEVLTHII